MDDLNSSNTNFFSHVFNFNTESKSEMLNILQYALLAIIPMVVLIKLMNRYIPEADDKKGSLEIVAEIVVQVILMFMGLLIVHRIITFVPTYSGAKYPTFDVTFAVLAVFVTMISFQTKIGEKINVLIERIGELWEGTSGDKKKSKNKNNTNAKNTVQVQSQPASIAQTPNQAAMNQSLYTDGTSINSLPTNSQSLPDYNNMYANNTTPLVNAATPGQSGDEGFMVEPMAANSVLGGGSFGSW